MNSDVSVHQRRLHFLVTEVFKSVNNLNPHFKWNYFKMNCFLIWLKERKYIAPSSGTLNLPWNKFTLIPRKSSLEQPLRKASSMKNLRKHWRNTEPFYVHVEFVGSLDEIYVDNCNPAGQGIYSTTSRNLQIFAF